MLKSEESSKEIFSFETIVDFVKSKFNDSKRELP
jgi:hypothetical protein